MTDDLHVVIEDGIATVTLNRPGKRNAVHLGMWRQLATTFAELGRDAAVRTAILTGAGGNFCAGADISEFKDVRSDVQSGRVYEIATEAATVAIRDFPRPTIAAVSGVGDPTTRMGIPAARLGIIYSPLDCGLLHRQVGLAQAKRVLFSGRYFGLDECLRMGLVDVEASDALTGARELAAEFASNAPLSLEGSKLVLEALDADAVEARGPEIHALTERAIESADYREGARAFLEKRRPAFTGG